MEIEDIRQGDVVIVAPHGRLDAAAEGVFERKVKALLDEQARFVVVDFGKVDYVSGGALRALLLAIRRLGPRGGRLVLCRVSGVVKQAFAIAGFDRVFAIVPTRAEAVTQASGAEPATAAAADSSAAVDARVARIAALALPLLAAGDQGGRIAALQAAGPRTLGPGLGELACRVLADAAG